MDEPGIYYNVARHTGIKSSGAVVVCKLLLSTE